MRISIVLLVAALWVASSAAGPNEGGVLVVHHDPSAIATNACGSITLPSSCEELDPTAESISEPVLWFVLAAFPDSVADRFSTVTFGLGSYNDTTLVMGDWGPCELLGQPLEIPSAGWPAPNTGTSVSWAPSCGSGDLIPVYWFLTYAYASGAIPLGDYYPGQNGSFVSCGSPPAEELINDYGTIGFGTSGGNPCPTGFPGPGGFFGSGGEAPEYSGGAEPLPDDVGLIITNTTTSDFMETARDLRREYGLDILVGLTPDAVIAGNMTSRLKILLTDDERVAMVTFDTVPSPPEYNDPNEIPSDGRWIRHVWNYLLDPPDPPPTPTPPFNEPTLAGGDTLHDPSTGGTIHTPEHDPAKQTSVFLIGDVGARLVFVESNEDECPCPPTENWKSDGVIECLAEICQGFIFLADFTPDANLSFFVPEPPLYPGRTTYEPITMSHELEFLWINQIMDDLGYAGEPDYIEQCWDHNNDMRRDHELDWAYINFIVEDDADDDHAFADGVRSYALRYGPRTVVLHNGVFRPDRMDVVFRHESAHIFGAADEHSGSDCDEECDDFFGYLHFRNDNCFGCTANQEECIMADGGSAVNGLICQWTRGQLGWYDDDDDGPFDPIDHHSATGTMQMIDLDDPSHGTYEPGDVLDIYNLAFDWVKRLAVTERTASIGYFLPQWGMVWDGVRWNGNPAPADDVYTYVVNGQGSPSRTALIPDTEAPTLYNVIISPGAPWQMDNLSFEFEDDDTYSGVIRARVRPAGQNNVIDYVYWDEFLGDTYGQAPPHSRDFGPVSGGSYELDLLVWDVGGGHNGTETIPFTKDVSADVPDHLVVPKLHIRSLSSNPSRDWFTFEVESPASQELDMKVVGVDGRVVRSWRDVRVSAGYTKVLWDGLNDTGDPVGSGKYYLWVQDDSRGVARKAVVVLK